MVSAGPAPQLLPQGQPRRGQRFATREGSCAPLPMPTMRDGLWTGQEVSHDEQVTKAGVSPEHEEGGRAGRPELARGREHQGQGHQGQTSALEEEGRNVNHVQGYGPYMSSYVGSSPSHSISGMLVTWPPSSHLTLQTRCTRRALVRPTVLRKQCASWSARDGQGRGYPYAIYPLTCANVRPAWGVSATGGQASPRRPCLGGPRRGCL